MVAILALACAPLRNLPDEVEFPAYTGLEQTRRLENPWPEDLGALGYAVAAAGDVDGDGFADMLISSRHYTNTKAVFLLPGGPDGVHLDTAQPFGPDGRWQEGVGQLVLGPGDLDNDGHDDVVITLPNDRSAETGALGVFYGSPDGLDRHEIINPPCLKLAWTGDLDGDEHADFLAGCHEGAAPPGGFSVVSGDQLQYEFVEPEQPADGEVFGRTPLHIADVNGDGQLDVVASSTRTEDGSIASLYLYTGDGGRFSPEGRVLVFADASNALLHDTGDLNGDGFADALVRMHHAEASWMRVYPGSAAGLRADFWELTHPEASNAFGLSASIVSDLDGDGISEVLIGDYGWTDNNFLAGAVWLYPSSGAEPWPLNVGEGEFTACFGRSVAEVGDLDGDGRSELAIGDRCMDEAAGVVHLFSGVE